MVWYVHYTWSPHSRRKISLYTDASSLGFGAYYGTHWFSQAWPKKYQAPHIDISYRELFAVTTAVFTWVALLRNKHVILYSDNMAVVRAWHSGSCKDKNLMSLIRPLFLFCASNSITLSLKHVPGKKNVLADLLSRLQVLKFRQQYPQADLAPSLIHPGVWTLWEMSRIIFSVTHWLLPHCQHTGLVLIRIKSYVLISIRLCSPCVHLL